MKLHININKENKILEKINNAKILGNKFYSISIGNLFIRKEGKEDFLPVVAFGSHIDTVVNAGKFEIKMDKFK